MKLFLRLAFLSALNLATTFLFNFYILFKIGAGQESDALFMAMTMPQLLIVIVSGTIMHALVPLLAGENKERLHHDSWLFLMLITMAFSLIAILLYLTAKYWIPLLAMGYSDETKFLTIEITEILLISMVFSAINSVQCSSYHARNKFILVEATSVLTGLLAILLLVWWLPRYGIIAAAWITMARACLQTMFLMPGMGWPMIPDFRSNAVHEGYKRIKPLLLGSTYYKSDILVDRAMLSMAGSGTLSVYYFAQQLYGAYSQVLNKSIISPLVSNMSAQYKLGDADGFRKQYIHAMKVVSVSSCLAFLILIIFGRGIFECIPIFGGLTASDVDQLWWIMIYLGAFFVFGATGQVSSSAFFAIGDSVTPTRIGIYAFTLYVPLKIFFFNCYGVKGLALSTSAFLVINFIIQGLVIESRFSSKKGI